MCTVCSQCPRSYHVKCLHEDETVEEDWVCGDCKKIAEAEEDETKYVNRYKNWEVLCTCKLDQSNAKLRQFSARNFRAAQVSKYWGSSFLILG